MLLLDWLKQRFDTVEFVDGWQPVYRGPDDVAYWAYSELSYRLTLGDLIFEVYANTARELYRCVCWVLRQEGLPVN